ncbi:hypothetical protein C8Q77DRAFT_1077982 [Trametes polyzona]|nr:hypothetical protein C8Q77DRAFT_1077982 [Trametes polyzona]
MNAARVRRPPLHRRLLALIFTAYAQRHGVAIHRYGDLDRAPAGDSVRAKALNVCRYLLAFIEAAVCIVHSLYISSQQAVTSLLAERSTMYPCWHGALFLNPLMQRMLGDAPVCD